MMPSRELPLEEEKAERDFVFYATFNEILNLTAMFVEDTRNSKTDIEIEVNLKMASRTLRSAMEIYAERLHEMEERQRK